MEKLIISLLLLPLLSGCEYPECIEYKTYCYTTDYVTTTSTVMNMNGGGVGLGVGSASVDTYFPCDQAEHYPDPRTENRCERWE